MIDAISKYPEYMSGSDRIENYIMKKYPGKVILKSGCNGYFAGIDLDIKLGFAIKTFDGIVNTRDLVLINLIKKLDIIKKEDYDCFDKIYPTKIRNHRGEVVGEIKSLF